MTPIPRHNSDDSSEDHSDVTESEEEKIIYSMCYDCNEKVLAQMKMNGTCHGRCFYCHRRQRHLVCAEVNPDKMIDGVPHTYCEICHQYVTYETHTVSSQSATQIRVPGHRTDGLGHGELQWVDWGHGGPRLSVLSVSLARHNDMAKMDKRIIYILKTLPTIKTNQSTYS